jgi:hypothetical protein
MIDQNDDVTRLWEDYIAAEHDRIRDVTMPALDRFIDALLQQPSEEWMLWAKDLAAGISDSDADIPVRFPLFRRVLLPALARGVLAKEPGPARWLAHFGLLSFHSDLAGLPTNLRTPVDLLREALRVDPTDVRARERIIAQHRSFLEYTVHELPAGVLYGQNGATATECLELLELLEEFKTHVEAAGRRPEFEALIAECELHYRRYREYILAGCPGGSYERFVAGGVSGAGA